METAGDNKTVHAQLEEANRKNTELAAKMDAVAVGFKKVIADLLRERAFEKEAH